MNGALNGSIVTARAYISEITDSSNQALAFSLITVGWGVGATTGPAIGVFLSSPATKVFGHVICLKHFLICCLV